MMNLKGYSGTLRRIFNDESVEGYRDVEKFSMPVMRKMHFLLT